MVKPSVIEVQEAISIIIQDEKNHTKTLNYAIDYCRSAIILDMSGSDLKTQVLYILNNIQYWRGPFNKEVRKTLQEYVK